MSAPFDTLTVSQRLTAGGFTTVQAYAAAEAFSDALRAEMATKADIANVTGEVQKAKLDLEAKIQTTKSELVRWVAGIVAV